MDVVANDGENSTIMRNFDDFNNLMNLRKCYTLYYLRLTVFQKARRSKTDLVKVIENIKVTIKLPKQRDGSQLPESTKTKRSPTTSMMKV